MGELKASRSDGRVLAVSVIPRCFRMLATENTEGEALSRVDSAAEGFERGAVLRAGIRSDEIDRRELLPKNFLWVCLKPAIDDGAVNRPEISTEGHVLVFLEVQVRGFAKKGAF